jgi:hypothetical protein
METFQKSKIISENDQLCQDMLISSIELKLKPLRKYNTAFRKKLVNRFEKIKEKSDYIIIYNIITQDIGNDFSSNRNGIFININILSDLCISKIINFMDEKLNINITCSENEKINYKIYKFDEAEIMTEMGHKLSNQEKNIIKRIRNKAITT